MCVCVFVAGGRAVSEPYCSQRAQCLRLSERFIIIIIITIIIILINIIDARAVMIVVSDILIDNFYLATYMLCRTAEDVNLSICSKYY